MQAALTLAELGWKPVNPVWNGWFLVATQNWAAIQKHRVASRGALANVLEDEPSDVRKAAVSTLEALGGDAIPALVTALQESSTVAVHRTACDIIRRIAESYVGDDPSTTDELARAYAILGDAIPALIGVLQIPESPAVIDAGNALASIAEAVGQQKAAMPALQSSAAAIKDANRGLHAVYQESLDVARQRILRVIEGKSVSDKPKQDAPVSVK